MGYIVRRIPFLYTLGVESDEKTSHDYYACFEPKYAFKLKEKYRSPEEAYADGCKFVFQDREGIKIYNIIEGVDPDIVSKFWSAPKNKEESDYIRVNFMYTSPTREKALKWFVQNLNFVSSRYGINMNYKKFEEEIYE